MTWYSRSAWQVIAIAAFAATAVLAVTLTRPLSSGPARAASDCRAYWLDARVEPPVAAAEEASAHAVYTLEFTNISRQTCSLNGYPRVWAYDGGQQIGNQAARDTSVRPSPVTLAPGATAHAVLRYTPAARIDAASCDQVTVRELRIYLPPSGGSVLVRLTIPACSRKGRDFLTVQAVQPRAGIPGFPRALPPVRCRVMCTF